ncbi:MAG: group III truncated hemoglobin [Rhodospirillaceae bacterium]|nr:group III truncated hemoglobin [Rhodospirillaceae bacterium]
MTHLRTDMPGVTEDKLADLVARFYAKVRRDALIGGVFNRAVGDWPEHLEKLARFWSSIMLTSGAYKGNPMAAHTKHVAEITPAMFDRWLELWAETTAEVFDPAAAAILQSKASHIARSLKLALAYTAHSQSAPASA